MDIVFGISFFTLNNVKINCNNWKPRKKSYTISKALLITRWVKLVGKKEFATIAFYLDDKIFIVYVAFFISLDPIYHFYNTQIPFLKADKTFSVIPIEHTDFVDIFSLILTTKLLEYIKINNYIINLLDNKYLYSLVQV